MNDKNEKSIEIFDNKSILKETPRENINYKKRNVIYIFIILISIIGIILFLTEFKEKQKLEIVPRIVDRTGEYCAESLKFFYTDKYYKYYFSCMKNYYVLYDGVEYKIEDALNKKIIKISDLDKNNITYYKEQLVK